MPILVEVIKKQNEVNTFTTHICEKLKIIPDNKYQYGFIYINNEVVAEGVYSDMKGIYNELAEGMLSDQYVADIMFKYTIENNTLKKEAIRI